MSMDSVNNGNKKKPRCFCKVPLNELSPWAFKKFVSGKTTLELLNEAANDRDREMIRIIALLDVDTDTLNTNLGHEAKPTCNLEKCRRLVRAWLLEVVSGNNTPDPPVLLPDAEEQK